MSDALSKDVAEKRLLAHNGVYLSVFARNCEVRRISREVADDFLVKYHSLGSTGSRYRYGLFVSRCCGSTPTAGSLIAVATFSSARKWVKLSPEDKPIEVRSCEWIRYACLPELRICGGMGKMLKAFISDVGPDDVMTYALEEAWKADLPKACGDVYLKLGFSREEKAPDGRIKFRLKLTEYKD